MPAKLFSIRALILFLICVAGCNRKPDEVSRKYLESGNQYFEKKKYREASILYRTALKKNPRFGEAHYRQGLTELMLQDPSGAVQSLRRAIELLPEGTDRVDARVKLADLYVLYLERVNRERVILGEAEDLVDALLRLDRQSFDGLRLKGAVGILRARELASKGLKTDGEKELRSAIEVLRAAHALKPENADVAIDLARSLAASGQAGPAEEVLSRLVERQKQVVVAYMNLVRLYGSQKRWQDVERILKLGLESNPKHYDFYTDLATFQIAWNRRPEAIATMERLKKEAPDSPRSFEIAAQFYLRLGDPQEATRQCEAGMRAFPKESARYRQVMVDALLAQNKRSEAVALNDSILTSSPDDVDAQVRRASFLLEEGKPREAIPALEKALHRNPNNPLARYNLGRAEMAAGQPERARFHLVEAVRWGPSFIPARLALADVYLQTDEFGNAENVASEVLEIDPANHAAKLIRAVALRGLKKYQEARTSLRELLAERPGNDEAWYQLGLVEELEGRKREAEAAFRKSFEANGTNVRGLRALADAKMLQKEPAAALALYQAEVKRQPSNIPLRTAFADTAYLVGRYDVAATEYKALLPFVEKDPMRGGDMALRLGEAYRKLGDSKAALVYLEQARKLRPESGLVLHSLAVLYDYLGRRQEAKDLYEATLKLNGENAVALNNLASYILDSGGDLDQALTYAQRARQKMPARSEILDTVAQIYLKKGLTDNAIELFSDLARRNPTDAQYRFHYGVALLKKGDRQRARTELLAAQAGKPAAPDAARISELLSELNGK